MIGLVRNDALGKLILRLTLGGLMLFHGIAKVLNPESVVRISGMLDKLGVPGAVAYGVFLGEIIAPLMIVFGIYARVGGLIIAGNMLFALVLAHSGDFLSLTQHGGWALELQAFYLFCALAILFLGSGRFAVRPD